MRQLLGGHSSFPRLVHAARCYVHVTKEGNPSDFWGTTLEGCRQSHDFTSSVGSIESYTQEENIDKDVLRATNHSEDISAISNQGFEVDDNNEPSLENIPPPGTVPSQGLKPGQTGGGMTLTTTKSSLQRRKSHHMLMVGHPWVFHTTWSFFTSFHLYSSTNPFLSIQVMP